MQTSSEQTARSAPPAASASRLENLRGSGPLPRKSALFGLRLAVPAALGFWALLAALIWMFTH